MAENTYVVRIDTLDGDSDFKAFSVLADARKRFEQGSTQVARGDFAASLLFEAGEPNARAAVDMVKAGKAILIERDPWARIDREIMDSLDDMILKDSPDA